MSVFAEIRAQAWKLATAAGVIATIAMGLTLMVTTARLHDAQAAADALTASINAPGTGWAARLTTCQNNNTVLQAGIESQNAAIKRNGEEAAKRLAEADKALAAAQRQAGAAEAKVTAIMKPLVGTDTCLRIIEADERLMESLK